MKPILYIGNKNYSSWSLRAWLCAKHVGLDFEEILIPLRQEKSSEKIGEISESKKVPCLHHDGVVVWDSLAIAEYLNELFPEKNLFPKDQKVRALARSICSEMHSGFLNLRTEMSMNMKEKIDKEASEATKKEIARILEIWQSCLEKFNGKFLFGDFSVADAFFAPVVSRFITYKVDVGGLEKYLKNISEHADYKEWQDAAFKEETY